MPSLTDKAPGQALAPCGDQGLTLFLGARSAAYYLGGPVYSRMRSDHRFRHLGYAVQELSGRSVQAFGLGLQVALPKDLFITAGRNTARMAEQSV